MKKKFLNNSMKVIKKYYPEYDEEELEKIEYGLEAIYLTLTKVIIVYSLAYFFGILLETFLVSLTYNLIRLTAFGMHASKSIYCLIISLITFIGGALLVIYLNIPLSIKVILSIISVYLIYKYAPADTEKRPIISPKRRNIYKTISTITGIIFTILIIVFNKHILSNYLLIGMIEAVITLLPITYKIFKLPYDNYKNYNFGLSN